MTDAVTIVRNGQVLEITLDRPKANAIDAATSKQLSNSFVTLRDDPDLRVAILTGAGERFFTAGWDLNAAAEGEEFESDYGPGGFGGFGELIGLTKPVILAVNGMAVGGGFEMTMAADLVIAAEHAEFFLPETAVGIIPDVGTIRLPKLLPHAVAMEVLIGGRRLDANEALKWGIVNEVVPADQLMHRAREMAERLLAGAPMAVAAIIDMIKRTSHLSIEEGLELMRSGTVELYEAMLTSEDAKEGPRSFVEKRSPRWTGR